MSNFAFIPADFRGIADSAKKSEGQIMGDPRSAGFQARYTLERVVHWLYQHDSSLRMPYDDKLGALIHEATFKQLLPQAVWQKARVIQRAGNLAVHGRGQFRQYDALQVVKELHHLCYWLVRTYAPDAALGAGAWDQSLVPAAPDRAPVASRAQLEVLEKQLEAQSQEALRRQQERAALDEELQTLRAELESIKAAATAVPDTHDYSEAETRRYLIDVDLKRAGWPLDQKRDREYEVTGMPNNKGVGYVDYVLWGDDGKPLAVIEAKKTTVDPQVGKQQAKLYADCVENMHGRRPIIFYTNGYETWLWDDRDYPPRKVAGFYKKDELSRLILRRAQKKELDVAHIKDEIVNRYYQKRAIGSIAEHFDSKHRKALLVMATGTGKTRTAIALIDLLQKAGWIKRALFLADRVSLVNQAISAFKAHLPESSPVNLVTEKNTEGRVYASTYPTMMGLIDQKDDDELRFGVGHFDLIVIDEAHRSVYQKYGAIFEYFDSLLVGLTATPREEVDKNTYDIFELEAGVPTDAYELSQAVSDGFLVPPQVSKVDLRFPRQGIDYDALSDEEKEQWESLDWGDSADPDATPSSVNAAAINNWLFNKDTVDKVLEHLMVHGHKVDGGDRLAKTIIFARNHKHALFIEERFNHHYAHYAGHFARVIDNYATYPQSLIDDFSIADKSPHIAISVDMLDTGIDVPEVANLVFFKPVYSKIKFWQMIGRGTRLCPDLYGPEMDKEDFRVFDFCFNFEFFKENPPGIVASASIPLSVRLFRARVDLLGQISANVELDPDRQVWGAVASHLRNQVEHMEQDNFLVRMRIEHVERFQKKDNWDQLSQDDRETLSRHLADLPDTLEAEEIESRLFDLTALRMQQAHASGDVTSFEKHRIRVAEMAMLLEEKASIPAVSKQLAYLSEMQDPSFWEGMGLKQLEEMRLRLRDIVPFLDKKERKVVYSDFKDEVTSVSEEELDYIPKMTGAQYEKKVKDYLRSHLHDVAIQRLRSGQPLTEVDLKSLEITLVQIGQDDGETLLSSLLKRSETPSLAHFIRSLVGFDRQKALEAFSEFLQDESLKANQIRFIELVISQLTARGVMQASALYEAPFTDIYTSGPDALFSGKEKVLTGIFARLNELQPSVIAAA